MEFNKILKKVMSRKGNALFYTPSIYAEAKSYLFENCSDIIDIFARDSTNGWETVDGLIEQGVPSFGMINYEYGFQIEEKLKKYSNPEETYLARFRFFNKDNPQELDSGKIVFDTDKIRSYEVQKYEIGIDEAQYEKDINQIKKYIYRGDTYQVNYTVNADFVLSGSVEYFIFNLIFNQSARYIAIINEYPELIISLSPELFFELKSNELFAKPMKGTIKRGYNIDNDSLNKEKLLGSVKDIAENTMIIDLLRNDLGKISGVNSVEVTKKYEVEKYESVYQLTSTIKCRPLDARLSNIVKNLFPCGSITGAPKIRTMEIIKELEKRVRGIYTGAIGITMGNKFTFNVPIRTVKLNVKKKTGSIGIGSGIVWDSDPISEYEEVKLKANFLTEPQPYFELIESMLIEKCTILLIDYHAGRLKESVDYFLFKFDETDFRLEVDKILANLDADKNYKLRLTLNKWGNFGYSCNELPGNNNNVNIILSSAVINPFNKFQYFKTTNRRIYDEEYKKYSSRGYYDCIYFNINNELCEGSRNNIIIKKNDKLLTPRISAGILNGCYRQYLIGKGEISESHLTIEDIYSAEDVYLCNAVRGLVRVKQIDSSQGKPIMISYTS